MAAEESQRDPSDQPSPARLIVTRGQTNVSTLSLTGEVVTLGRHHSNDLVLDDAAASRQHARIEIVGSEYTLTDLNSTNGTLVNGERITYKTLISGDEIQIGDTVMTFEIEGAPKVSLPLDLGEAAPAASRVPTWLVLAGIAVLAIIAVIFASNQGIFLAQNITPTPVATTRPTPVPPPTTQVVAAVPSATADVRPTGVLTVDRGVTLTPAPSSTIPVPSATYTALPTQVIPPYLYVTNIRIDPSPPERETYLNFYVTFLNTSSVTQKYRWNVYIYKQDDLKNSFGRIAPILTEVPANTDVEQKGEGGWNTGLGGCGRYLARVVWLDEANKETFFTQPDGQVFEWWFQVCGQ